MKPVFTRKYLLVIIYTDSRWIEAKPTKTEKDQEVVWLLLREIVPQYGIPLTMDVTMGPPL